MVLLAISVVGLGATAILYNNLRDANQQLSATLSQNTKLEAEIKKLDTELHKFDDIEKSDLLKLCTERAGSEYTDYVRKNSISAKEGNVTTLYPKSPDTLRLATEQLKASEKSCTDKFGS